MISLVLVAMSMFMNSCKKEEEDPIVTAQKTMKFFAGTLTQNDNDLSFLKSAPVGAHRLWSVYCHPVTTPNSGSWNYVVGSQFYPGSLAQLDWDNASKWATGMNHVYDLSYISPIAITYTPDVPVKVVSKTVTAAPENKVLYLAVKNFTPTTDYTIAMKGRELKDVLKIDLSKLKIKGYRFTIELNYDVKTIDVDATALACESTDAGWPTYIYTSTTATHLKKVFIVDEYAQICTQNGIALGSAATAELFNEYGTKILNLTAAWKIEQQQQDYLLSNAWIAYKTQLVYAINDNVPGIGLNLMFATDLKGYVNGRVDIQDVDISLVPILINVDQTNH